MQAQDRAAPRFELLLISDGSGDEPRLERQVGLALAALPQGVAALQLREKTLTTRALAALCRRLLPLCRSHRAPLLVNDRCDLALALGLDGVHLAQTSITATDARALLGAQAIIGVSCHDAVELGEAQPAASYAAFGPIYPPRSKPVERPPLGLEALRRATARDIPIFALGGVTADRAAEVRACGARGLAVIGSGLGADDPAREVASLWRAWQGTDGS